MTILCSGMGEPDFFNNVRNGSFATHIIGWVPTLETTLLSHEATETHSGPGGSLAVAMGGGQTGGLFDYRAGGGPANRLVGSPTTMDFVAYAKGGTGTSTLHFDIQFFNSPYGTAKAGGAAIGELGATEVTAIATDTWTEVPARGLAVPVGATHYTIHGSCANMDATPLYVDDIFFGNVGTDVPPYPTHVIPLAANRVLNGDFTDPAIAWGGYWGNETFAINAGRLSVTTANENANEGALYMSNAVVIPGETVRFAFTGQGPSDMQLDLYFYGAASPSVTAWSGSFGASPTPVSVDVVVPANAWATDINIITSSQQDVTFFVDDVFVGTPT